eukprot:14916090-Ditylum_brightwellii.AAC.1
MCSCCYATAACYVYVLCMYYAFVPCIYLSTVRAVSNNTFPTLFRVQPDPTFAIGKDTGEAAKGEVKRGKGMDGNGCGVEGHIPKEELKVFEEKGCGLCFGSTEAVLSWVEQEEKGKPDE